MEKITANLQTHSQMEGQDSKKIYQSKMVIPNTWLCSKPWQFLCFFFLPVDSMPTAGVGNERSCQLCRQKRVKKFLTMSDDFLGVMTWVLLGSKQPLSCLKYPNKLFTVGITRLNPTTNLSLQRGIKWNVQTSKVDLKHST